MRPRSLISCGGFALAAWVTVLVLAADKQTTARNPLAKPGMTLPEFDKTGALLRPVDFEKWTVVGTSIGLGYADGPKLDPDNPGQFQNVYLQPEAFDHFVATGEFPEQTVFILTNLPSKSTKKDQEKADVLRKGFFAGSTVGLEVSVKDSQRFPDGWAYYTFHDKPGETKKARDAERPMAKKECYNCHAKHAATNHVFTQYYSVLTAAREKRLAHK